MKRLLNFAKHRNLFSYTLFFFVVAGIFNFSRVVELASPSVVSLNLLEDPNKVEWQSSNSIKPGEYYFSFGRVQGSCNFFHNGSLLDSSEGTSVSARSGLFLGSKVVVKDNLPQTFNLICYKTPGSPIRLIHKPHLSTYRSGMLVHLIRIITDQFLPCLALSLILMFIFFTLKDHSFNLPLSAKLCALFTLLYFISLSNVPYLFFPNIDAIFFHSILKLGFVFSILTWICGTGRTARFLLVSGIGITLLFVTCFFIKQEIYMTVYTSFVNAIPFIGIISYALSTRGDRKNVSLLVHSAVPFTLFSIIDCIAWNTGTGPYLSTSSTFAIFTLATYKYLRHEKAKSLARKTISIIASKQLEKSSTTESLSQIAMILSECLRLREWSVYIDSYNLGSSPKPGRELRRIASSLITYKTTNAVISFEGAEETFGRVMKEALKSGLPVTKEANSNGSVYTVIPIGNICCINLSGTSRSKLGEEFIKTFISEAYQQINAIAQTIIKFESAASFSITLLKEELGIGTHDFEFGAIFADAVGYTQNVKASKSFIEFFEREYLPSLLRNLDKKVILKDLFGDELYLVVLPKSLTGENDKNIYATTMSAVQLIQEFSQGKGADLCTGAGYKPIEFRMGANAGMGQIVVSHSNVALSGPVIEAKRCQGRAHASEPFVTEALLENASELLKNTSVRETYAAKKEILNGFRIRFKNRAA